MTASLRCVPSRELVSRSVVWDYRHGRDGRGPPQSAGGIVATRPAPGEHPDQLPRTDPGTPLANAAPVEPFELVRLIATTRLTFPLARVRLSAGRQQMSEELQTLCFLAGANSIFYGEKLLTAANPAETQDRQLFQKLGLPLV
jgi:biotin synthase